MGGKGIFRVVKESSENTDSFEKKTDVKQLQGIQMRGEIYPLASSERTETLVESFSHCKRCAVLGLCETSALSSVCFVQFGGRGYSMCRYEARC